MIAGCFCGPSCVPYLSMDVIDILSTKHEETATKMPADGAIYVSQELSLMECATQIPWSESRQPLLDKTMARYFTTVEPR